MKKSNQISIYSLFLFIALLLLGACKHEKEDHIGSNESFKKIYPLALRGEMKSVLNLLDTIKVETLDFKESKIRDQFIHRFKKSGDAFDPSIQDKNVAELVNLFRIYWTDVMLDNLTVEIADSLLIHDLANLLSEDPSYEKHSVDSISDNPYLYVNEYLETKSYHSNAMGKTSHLYDLFLWRDEEVKNYKVELIEDTVEVEVHFMKDFISKGWTHYATLGKNYASGWATSEALFTMNDSYDRNSENFIVSYLAHEAQHFTDYIRYPEFGQRELEYRAKLIEIIKSDSTTLNIIGKFIRNAKAESANAHAWANYEVISDLSKILFDESFVGDFERWNIEITYLEIKEAGEILLNASIKKLTPL